MCRGVRCRSRADYEKRQDMPRTEANWWTAFSSASQRASRMPAIADEGFGQIPASSADGPQEKRRQVREPSGSYAAPWTMRGHL